MIKSLALYIFGWRRVPERFVDRMAGFFDAHMRDHGFSGVQRLSNECVRSLSQLAYQRARRESERAPRFIYFVHELEAIARAVQDDFRGRDVHDERVRLMLEWHRRKEEPNQLAEATPSEPAVN